MPYSKHFQQSEGDGPSAASLISENSEESQMLQIINLF